MSPLDQEPSRTCDVLIQYVILFQYVVDQSATAFVEYEDFPLVRIREGELERDGFRLTSPLVVERRVCRRTTYRVNFVCPCAHHFTYYHAAILVWRTPYRGLSRPIACQTQESNWGRLRLHEIAISVNKSSEV